MPGDGAHNPVLAIPPLSPGLRVLHAELGEGVVLEAPHDGFVRCFFARGERVVPQETVTAGQSRNDRILAGVAGTAERLRHVWLCHEAHALPLMESATALTAARVDLLPHQIVLTHRIATASPRRFLIADEVGLGKTIETALLLRELRSRGELKRALMVVPAGLVHNWHRELNEVFNLEFEVFGSEGDVTDRKSNAFAKHSRLIASIDTLKRPARIRRLLEAQPWDLVVFDEAHHLTAYRSGRSVRKTENYKLAEALKGHTRDLILLSATPHQGDHFRFWMIIQLLNPTLFGNPEEMVAERHRLNQVVFRRTKADACRADGSPLFARRWVHTESFVMGGHEHDFYEALRSYLEDGFALAKRQGNKGRGLGFVMAIFQKLAASSFAAVRRTLRRRLLMLTIYEAILRDRDLDIDGRQRLYDEARQMIREEYCFTDTAVGNSEVDRVLADIKLRLVREIDQEAELELSADADNSELASAQAEELAAAAVQNALPEERQRISELLSAFPGTQETKIQKLLLALGALWKQNASEKVVIFATYLGTVDLIGEAIDTTFPGQGVVVLRGGDHGAKVAAEKRFKLAGGPKVLVCTAAGREGINLQFARVLFNFDLPWNPMDIEQRIGRIHRYGQHYTAQVYNLVLSDTIEGKIFLLLNDKLVEIAKALGKLDEHGNVAEDLRTQILGQLAERLSYERLYQEALSDPELQRTRQELEAAISNAQEARQVVFELFQDLDGFRLEDYQPFADLRDSIARMIRFFQNALASEGKRLKQIGEHLLELRDDAGRVLARFTTDRDQARAQSELELLGLDHPLLEATRHRFADSSSDLLGASAHADDGKAGALSLWLTEVQGARGETRVQIVPLAVTLDGTRQPAWERRIDAILQGLPTAPFLTVGQRTQLLREHLEPMLQRELSQRGLLAATGSFQARLVGWIEMAGGANKK